MAEIRIKEVSWHNSEAALMQVRTVVFVEEQNVPIEIERDEHDPACRHLLACDGDTSIGTARMMADGHIGRVAVLLTYRGQGIGAQLIAKCVEMARQANLPQVDLNAQTHALGFYENLGFVAEGDEFDEAGIPHRHMIQIL